MVGGQEVWKETEVSRMRPKSVISRVMKSGNRHVIHGFVLNDGSPLKSVEVKIDEGPWAAVTFDKSNTQFGWKLFSYVWEGATPGEHTLVSRDRCQRHRAADAGRTHGHEKNLPGRQLSVSTQGHDRVSPVLW
jgi:hypothetical protein